MYLNKILLTTDFSKESTSAFEIAIHEAKLSNSEITLLYIVEPYNLPIGLDGNLPPLDFIEAIENEHLKNAQNKLGELAECYFKNINIKTLALKSWDNVAQTISTYAKENNFGLIISANQGKSTLKRIILGSTTERIIRLASNPILVTQATRKSASQTHSSTAYRHILVTTDFSEDSEKAFKYAAYEAKISDAKITILHIIEDLIAPELFSMSGKENIQTDFDVQKIQDNYINSIKLKLSLYVKNHFPLSAVETKIVKRSSSVSSTIYEYIDKSDCDLIVMATHGANKSIQLLGGVAENLLRQIQIPFLLIPKIK